MQNETQAVNETKPARKGVFITMTPTQHRNLKVRAAQAGSTLQNLVADLLGEVLGPEQEAAPRRGGRNKG